jgi:type IV pilus assembly protein PilX
MTPRRISAPPRQEGVVLVIALIMLVILTLLGISAMQSTSLEERMAGNARDRSAAFQSAEAALREGERQLNVADTALPTFDDTNGFYTAPSAGDPSPWAGMLGSDPTSVTFWTTNGRTYGGTVTGVQAQPRYVIEELPYVPGVGDSFEAGLPEDRLPSYYRVTSRATGATDTAVVVVQSTYRRL